MTTFVDSAAFLAILNSDDQFHAAAVQAWDEILKSDQIVYSSNYILLETTALLQRRFGVEAVRLFESDIVPYLEIIWIDKATHKQAISALLAANRRNLSLVDCTSFEIARETAVDTVFTFDPHFREQGFRVTPFAEA